MMSLLCRFIWVVQSLDKVVDMPVIVNDIDCKQRKCLKLHRRQRQWHVAPGFAGIAFRAAFSTIAGRSSFCGMVVDTPVVYNDMGHGPDSAVPGQGCCHTRFQAGAVSRQGR